MIKLNITKWMYGFPSKVASANGSPHLFNIRITEDLPNMSLVGRGDWIAFDEYEQASTVPTFAGIIRQQAANGNWYIEVTDDTEAILLYNSPIIAEDYNSEFQKESNFYNAKGETVKGYSLIKGDIFEVSPEGFTGTPTAGKAVSYASGKYVVKTS